MLNFLEPTENEKVRDQNTRINNCGKLLKKKRQEIAIRNFSIRNIKRVELSCPENRRIEYGLETEQLFEWKGVDSEWKSGQLECPKGSFRDFDSRDKTYFCY